MIYTVCFEIIIQRAVGNELCYLIKKKTLIITVLYNTSRKSTLFHDNTYLNHFAVAQTSAYES
jgi:hypothetical protein